MTKEELAAKLNNIQYGVPISRATEAEAKASGLVIVYGASDDLMEFSGAFSEEVGAWNGATVNVDRQGVMAVWNEIDDDDRRDIDFMREYFKREGGGKSIEAIWAGEDGYSWAYRTDIPHATFEVLEDDDAYCLGIVFSLSDLGPSP